jgi:hypothetical protein
MIRTLALVAAVGFVLCIGCVAAAFAIAGGPFGIRDWAMVHSSDWGSHRHPSRHALRDEMRLDGEKPFGGAHTTRDFAWSGGDLLNVEVPADIVFTQGPKAKLTIAGPQDALDHLVVKDGRIGTDRGFYDGDRLKIVMTAPDIRRFDLSGSQNLVVEDYRQERLELDISGSAHVSAKGSAKLVVLDIAGSGDADLEQVVTDDARIDISGSGSAKVGPKKSARIDVSGDGEVTLTSKPDKLTTDISGSGHVSQPGPPN